KSIDVIFRTFDQIEKTEIALFSRRSFTYRCLNTIPLESPVRSHLYTKIFSRQPLPFTFHMIYLIFEIENGEQEELLFFNLINNSEILKDTKRLQVIENILSSQKNSEMAALCCDVIQTQLSIKYQFDELSIHFLKAIDILISNSKELQKITAIAFLKVFANKFWDNIENLTNPIKFEFANINRNDLNKRLTTYEIKQFCNTQQQNLPWVKILKADCDSRLGFNPYWYSEQFKQVELLFNTISYSGESSVNDLFNSYIGNHEITRKISLAGMIMTKFYLIRASRELNANEHILLQKTSKYLQSSQLPEHYKIYLLNFMTNENQLYKLRPNVKNIEMFISSIVAHVVALNISSAVNSSPLVAYIQALYDYKDTYILTCPSDEMASITNIIIAKDSGTRRYRCKCGNLYFIGDCGRPNQIGECNQCKNKIGGLSHNLNEGNSSIDGDKIKQSINVNDVKGYIIEDTFDTYYTVRTLHPASYRILRLFLHIIIGVQANLPTTVNFINNQDCDIVQYCKKHIENDWEALKNIFNCDDETLALGIHSILSDMVQESQRNVEKFTSPAQREAWEEYFNQQYVLPRIKNFIGTANNFRIALDKNAENLLEINETLEVTDQYNENYLPQEMPKLHSKISIVYGLYVHEPKDESLYLGATIEFLVQLQNNFLNDVIEISPKTCQSLKFIEKLDTQEPRYHLQSINLENAKSEQIINYNDIYEIFLYCQYNLRLGHGREIDYDLYKIEAELALELVYGKKLIKTNRKQMYLNSFAYSKELFSRSMTILEEIKKLVHQEPIPANNLPVISDNEMELLSALEITICFLKQTSGGNRDTLISDYIKKWMKSSVIKKDNSSYELLTRTGLQLKHIVALYELVEEHVADIVINCIPLKYQAELDESIVQVITKSIDFEKSISEKSTEIPAKAFLTALKRLIVRYLSTESTDNEIIKENVPISLYLVDNASLGLWPDYTSVDVIENKFPTTSLLTSHIYNVYKFVKKVNI
ncbi:16749_t:CDS:2, partial [Racocetra fulgida]